jgi:hypothetical protein
MSKFSRNFVSRKFSRKRKFDHFSACPLLLPDLFWSTIRIWQLWSACGHYCCPICFESPSGFNNFEVHAWTVQLSDLFWSTIRSRQKRSACPLLLSDLFWSTIRFDILRYFTIFPVSCIRFLMHFRFRESFRENFRYFCKFS